MRLRGILEVDARCPRRSDQRGDLMTATSEKLPDSDTYYMGIAIAVREKANCTGNRVGAVAVLENRVISTGYNGVPEGMKNCLENGCLRCQNPGGRFPSGTGYDLCICVHAEQNALLSAARFGIGVEGAVFYTTLKPCFNCLKEMVQARIAAVYYLHDWQPAEPDFQNQYDILESRIRDGVKQLVIVDSDAEWAVS